LLKRNTPAGVQERENEKAEENRQFLGTVGEKSGGKKVATNTVGPSNTRSIGGKGGEMKKKRHHKKTPGEKHFIEQTRGTERKNPFSCHKIKKPKKGV